MKAVDDSAHREVSGAANEQLKKKHAEQDQRT
jgi:hypothetical protein